MADEVTKWLRFVELEDRAKVRTTKVWDVVSKDRVSYLGQVRWYPHWRKYTFYSISDAGVFDEACLRDIASFIETRTVEHKAGITKI